MFEKGPPTLAISGQDPAPGAVGVPRGTPLKVSFSSPITSGYTMQVKNGAETIAGSSSLSADGTTVTFTPTGLLPADADITVTLSGAVSTDGATLATQTWSFHTRSTEPASSQTMFGDQVPSVSATPEGSAVELGVAFSPTVDGHVTAIRFFKGAGNLGTHTGSLWNSAGTRLATVTFVGETASGWQTATLSSPVAVSAGVTYVASYHAPQGHYSYTSGFFNSAWTKGDLVAPSYNNGRYLYGSGGYPTYTYGSANYFVDVVFERPRRR